MTKSKTAPAAEAKTDATPAPKQAPSTKPAPKKGKPKAALTLADLCERYVRHLEDEGKSPGTVSSYSAELKMACKHFGGDIPLATITTKKVAAYFECDAVVKLRSGKPKAPPSIAKSRRVLRLALCFAEQAKLIATAPIPEPAAKA